MARTFPSARSPECFVCAAMLDEDEGWSRARYFSETRMAELRPCDGERASRVPPTPERAAELRLVAERAIGASLELANRMEAA